MSVILLVDTHTAPSRHAHTLLSSCTLSLYAGGRNGEGGSEDPFLMGQLASAWTEGLQNSSADPNHLQVAVTLKHFVAVREPLPDPVSRFMSDVADP